MARMPTTVCSRSASPQNDQIGSFLSSARPRFCLPHNWDDGGEAFRMGGGQVPASMTPHGQPGYDHAVRVDGEVFHDIVKGSECGVAVIRTGGPSSPRLGKNHKSRHAVGTIEDRRPNPRLRGRDPILTPLAGPVQKQNHGKHARAVVRLRHVQRVLAFALVGLQRAQVETRRR